MKKNYTISCSVSTFWKVIVPCILAACAVGGLIGILVVDKMIMPHIVHIDRGIVTVPSLTGLAWKDAQQELFNRGLRLHIGSYQYDEKVPEDHVISQKPEAQENVKKGRMVVAVVSKGSEIGVIPDVVGMSERKAVLELKKRGFIVGKSKRDFCDDQPKDAVASISPKPGVTISKEMPLDMVISDGTKPTHANVPNLIGESLLEAKGKIEKSGLKLGKIEYKQNATVTPGTVISQSMPPESSVPLGSMLTVVVSVSK
jgi:eukaryotic-like serine/threonine-protein kinase